MTLIWPRESSCGTYYLRLLEIILNSLWRFSNLHTLILCCLTRWCCIFLIFNVYLQHRLQLTANQRYCFPLGLIYSWWSLCHNSKLLFPIQAFFPSWFPLTWWIWFIKESRFLMEIAFQLILFAEKDNKDSRKSVQIGKKWIKRSIMASSIPLTAIPYHHQRI